MAAGGPFTEETVETNRAGRLTDAQKKDLGSMSSGRRRSQLQIAAVFAAIGLLVWVAEGPSRYATVKPLVGALFLAIAGFIAVRGVTGADPLTADLRVGHVDQVEGAISKRAVSGTGAAPTRHYFDVAGQKVLVSRVAYESAPAAGIVRLFYLPKSHRLVSMERLPDRPLPPGALSSPGDLLAGVERAFHSRDEVQQAEARAQLASMAGEMRSAIGGAAAIPPGELDPRPLAESILGAWTNGAISISFDAAGTFDATMPGGMRRSGHWSVDSDGRLVADVTGQSEPVEAWVAGDSLTVKLMGSGIVLRRSAPHH